MSRPDDKSLRAILRRVMGGFSEKFAEDTKPPRPELPYKNPVTMFWMGDDFGWPTQQARNDIHANIHVAGELLKEIMTYRSVEPLGNMSVRILVTRAGLDIDLRRTDSLTTGEEHLIPFKPFRPGDVSPQQAESDRIMEELEDRGFFFENRDNALHALDYVLSTWIEEVRAPRIICEEGPEPPSFD